MSRHRGTLSLIAWQMLLSWAYIFTVTLAILHSLALSQARQVKDQARGGEAMEAPPGAEARTPLTAISNNTTARPPFS